MLSLLPFRSDAYFLLLTIVLYCAICDAFVGAWLLTDLTEPHCNLSDECLSYISVSKMPCDICQWIKSVDQIKSSTVSLREQLWWDVVVVTLVQDPEGPVVDVINIAPRTANAVHNQILDVETQEGQAHQFWNLLQNKRTISESGSRFSSIDWCFRNLLIFAAPWCRVKTGENRELL